VSEEAHYALPDARPASCTTMTIPPWLAQHRCQETPAVRIVLLADRTEDYSRWRINGRGWLLRFLYCTSRRRPASCRTSACGKHGESGSVV